MMITQKLLNGSGRLFVRQCAAPFYRSGKVFRIPYIGDMLVSGESPAAELLAIPNGYGYREDSNYLFRRIDRAWIVISDDRLAKIVEEAVDCWSQGIELTFESLQGLSGVDSSVITVAYCTGILGPYKFSTEVETPSKPSKIKISDGWFSSFMFEYMAYRHGLALYEFYRKTLPHITTAFCLHTPTVKAKRKGDVLETDNVVVEDLELVEIAEMCDGEKSVHELLRECGELYREEVAYGIALLTALGVVDLMEK